MKQSANGLFKQWRAGIGAVVWIMGSTVGGWAQTNLPQLESVYGGRVSGVDVIELSANRSRIFAATESANSIFYGDVDHSRSDRFATNAFTFRVVPDFNATANFGNVNAIAGHERSGKLFVAHNYGLLSCSTNAGSIVTNIAAGLGGGVGSFFDVLIEPNLTGENSTLLAISQPNMETAKIHFGTVDTSGTLTLGAGSPVNLGITNSGSSGVFYDMVVNPTNYSVYILVSSEIGGSTTNRLLKSSKLFNAFDSSTVFTPITLPSGISALMGDKTLGVGPDGRLFIGGANATNKVMLYSDDDGANWSNVNTGVSGTTGPNIDTAGGPGAYEVYFGTAVSSNKGVLGSWSSLPRGGTVETHPNDGVVRNDPSVLGVFYLTTDQGIGATTNMGRDIFEIDQGLEAVQIQDVNMTTNKNVIWTAAKSGIRRCANYLTTKDWSRAIFPNFDGSPYYSVALGEKDSSGDTAYAGNYRFYKTTDGGTNWETRFNTDVQGAAFGFGNQGYFSAIDVGYSSSDGGYDIVVAGYYDTGTNRGGVIIQGNSTNWSQVLGNVDVNDVLFTADTVSDTTSVYIAAAYDATTGSGGIYQVTFSGSSPVLQRVLSDPVSIRNVILDSSGGIYASGMRTNCTPVVYYKYSTSSTWNAMSTTGLPADSRPQANPNWRGPVLTVGKDSASNDIPIIAVGVKLYYYVITNSTWVTSDALTYPNGTQINVLYWDELLVGTDTGVYGQRMSFTGGSSTNQPETTLAPVYRLYCSGALATYEHLFTMNETETDILAAGPSWVYEGVAWYAATNQISDSVPLYRLYCSSARQHHYTIDQFEYDYLNQEGTGWTGEGTQYYVMPTQTDATIPVYRYYNSAYILHHFTISEDERAGIDAHPEWGYVYELIAFYVAQSQ